MKRGVSDVSRDFQNIDYMDINYQPMFDIPGVGGRGMLS